MFARCTKWPSQDTNCEGQNLPLTECHNVMNLGYRCGSSFVHFHVLRVRHLCVGSVVFARRRNWNSQRCKVAGRKVMSNPRSKSYALHRHNVHEYSCSPKTIRWHNMWLLRILMNKIEFQKTTHHLDLGETKNWLASTKWSKKPHPNRSIELRSNTAWTWTHQRNDQNMWFNKSHQSIETCNAIRITSKTMHCQEYSRSPANTITSNSEPKTIIQNEPTSPLRNKNVDETRMFPCHVPSHQRHTNFELNSTRKFQKILTTMIVGNKTPMLKPHLRDLNTQTRKSSKKFFGILNKGKLAMVKPKMARLSPHEHFGNSCVFQFSPFVSAEAMNESPKLMQMSRRKWTSTSTFKRANLIAHWFIRAECEETGWHRQHESYILFQQRHVDVSSDHQPTKATELSHWTLCKSRFDFGERRCLPRNPVDNLPMALDMNCRSLQMRRRFFCGSKIKLLHVPRLAGNLMVQWLRSSILQNASNTSTYVGAAWTVLIWLRAKWGNLRETGADCFGLSLFEYRRGKLTKFYQLRIRIKNF